MKRCRKERGGCGERFPEEDFLVKQITKKGPVRWGTCKRCYKNTDSYRYFTKQQKSKQGKARSRINIEQEMAAASLDTFNQLMRNM